MYRSKKGCGVSDVDSPFWTVHPTATTKPTLFDIGHLGFIQFFIPGKNILGTNFIARSAADTAVIIYLYVHVEYSPKLAVFIS